MDTAWTQTPRFSVVYRISTTPDMIETIAQAICLEQTVEVTRTLIPPNPIGNWILGNIEHQTQIAPNTYHVTISYPIAIVANELPQLLNVILGNTSLTPGVRVEQLNLTTELLQNFHGPRYGITGIRNILNAPTRPILASAIKPMGLNIKTLAQKAHHMALGGLDIIKDDHSLTNQP
ncbi:hypothetical protein TI04_12295, partial [Achromatium sp. WMS2]